MAELLDRLLGFMPQRSVFWTALGTSVIIIIIQYIRGLLENILILPWMKQENLKKRERLLQGQDNKQGGN